jgi:hypothetical protein
VTDAELQEKRGAVLTEALACLRVIAGKWPDLSSGQLAAVCIRTCAAMAGVTNEPEQPREAG